MIQINYLNVIKINYLKKILKIYILKCIQYVLSSMNKLVFIRLPSIQNWTTDGGAGVASTEILVRIISIYLQYVMN